MTSNRLVNIRSVMIFLFFLCSACKEPPISTIDDLGHGVIYERRNDLRALNHKRPPKVLSVKGLIYSDSYGILVPGDIVWCKIEHGIVFGQKVRYQDPLEGSFHENELWGKEAFFAINTKDFQTGNLFDDKQMNALVHWFDSSDQLEAFRNTIVVK